jgi:hypothetical protein
MDISENQNIHNLPVPNIEAMREHLEHLFGGYLDGLHDGMVELAWTSTRPNSDGRYALSRGRQFGTDQLEEMAQEAARLNAQEHCNVYVGAALRKSTTLPGARASDADFLGLTSAYVDLDDDGATTRAKDIYKDAKPTKIVVTGRAPYIRAQCWWRLTEPITDPVVSEAILKGISSAFGGDTTVCNPARVMRLAGSIAWPMKPERQVEPTYIAPLKEPGSTVYETAYLAQMFPPVYETRTDGLHVPGEDGTTRARDVFGFAGKVNDGRDVYLRNTVEAVMIQLIGETGRCPTPQELINAVWPQYSQQADLTKAGKGDKAVVQKCAYTIKRFLEGRIKGCRSLDEALRIYADKRARGKYDKKADYTDHTGEFAKEAPKVDPAGNILPLILTSKQFADSFKPPSYIVDGIIQRGYLYSLTARTGHGKTAVIMRACADIVRGEKFAGCETHKGSVLYLAGENPQDVRARYVAMCDVLGIDTNTAPFYFIDGRVDIEYNLARLRAEAEAIPDLRLIVVDTAAAYFQGDDGNSNAQLARYAGLLRQLTFLPSLPTGIVNCHPVKNAAADNLLPMGGSAFVNEVDGNLTLWSGGDKTTTLHWQGKFRGPEFDPLSFELKEITSLKVRDEQGRLMPTVMAEFLLEAVADRRGAVNEEDENVLLRLIHADKHASMTVLAKRAGFTKSKVQRLTRALKEDGMARKFRGTKYRVTKKGCAAVGLHFGDEIDED